MLESPLSFPVACPGSMCVLGSHQSPQILHAAYIISSGKLFETNTHPVVTLFDEFRAPELHAVPSRDLIRELNFDSQDNQFGTSSLLQSCFPDRSLHVQQSSHKQPELEGPFQNSDSFAAFFSQLPHLESVGGNHAADERVEPNQVVADRRSEPGEPRPPPPQQSTTMQHLRDTDSRQVNQFHTQLDTIF